MTANAEALLASAQDALATGDTDRAQLDLRTCVEVGDLPDAHVLLGDLCYFSEQVAQAQEHWQLAFNGLRATGREREAACMAIKLAGLHVSMLGNDAAGQGWRERARMLLDRVGPCVEWGYLELATIACDRPNLEDLLSSTEVALSMALEFGDSSLETQALADSGLALVTMGRHREGFARLDAALAAISAGEVDSTIAGKCFCSMLSACERTGDLARAQEWIAIIHDRIGDDDTKSAFLHVHCRLVWGSVLCAAGRWPEAESEFLRALGPDDHPHVAHRALTIAYLASLRIEQGRLEEAEALLSPFEDRVTSCIALSQLHVARGNPDLAVAVLRRGLNELIGDAVRRAQFLAAVVTTELQRGDIDEAVRAASELRDLAHRADGGSLVAESAVADARICAAIGDVSGACSSYDAAVAILSKGERPYQLGLVRLEYAQLEAERGNVPTAISQARAALACFERLGATTARDRAASLLRSLGDTGRSRPQALGELVASLTQRECEVLKLLQEGLTNAQIAQRLFISPKTTEHHVGRILSKLGVRSRAEAAALAVRLAASGVTK